MAPPLPPPSSSIGGGGGISAGGGRFTARSSSSVSSSSAAAGGRGGERRDEDDSSRSRRRRALVDVTVFLLSLFAFLASLAHLHRHTSTSGGGGGGAAAPDGSVDAPVENRLGLERIQLQSMQQRQSSRSSPPLDRVTIGGIAYDRVVAAPEKSHLQSPSTTGDEEEEVKVLGPDRVEIGGKVYTRAGASSPSAAAAAAGPRRNVTASAAAAPAFSSHPGTAQRSAAASSASVPARETDTDPKEEENTEKKKPMNILLLYADDWRHDTLGVAGNPVVKTPTLDRLASEGVRFTHNCVTTSVCWSSRVTLYTGEYTGRHNTTKPKHFFVNWNETIYDLLKENGYHVGHVGKWGVNHRHKRSIPFAVEDDGWHVRKLGPKTWHITEKNEADALRFLETRPRDRPFFVNVAFFATHAVDGDKRQYLPQNSSLSMYVDDVVPDPITNTMDSFRRLPRFFNDRNEGRTRWRWRYETEEKRQSMMKNYYRMATEVDSACGVILKELEMQGELDNTVIIFTTDNGNFHAEHGLADKWYPHQESIRVPLIVKDPRMDPAKVGTTNDEFTLNIDLAPTILGAAGVEPVEKMMGRDVSVLYRTPPEAAPSATASNDGGSMTASARSLRERRIAADSSPWRSEFFYEHPVIISKNYIPASEALVRKDYKYFYWPNFGVEQLFQLREDPLEDRDLLAATTTSANTNMKANAGRRGKGVSRSANATLGGEHGAVLEEMRRRFKELKGLIQGTRDPVIL